MKKFILFVVMVCSMSFAVAQPYCTPAPQNVDGSGITNISMGTIDNTTAAETGNYGDYSAMSTDAPQSLPLAIDITLEAGFTYNLWVWVDWNNDFDFDDAGEEFYLGNAPSDNPTTFSASITVPPTALLGDHRIRIGGADNGLGNTSPSDPCYTGTYASFEDYTLNVSAAPSCLPVSDISPANATGTSVDMSWIENSTATVWDIEVVETGNAATGTPTNNDITNPFTITGLVPGTSYTFYIRADCGMDDTDASIWTAFSFDNYYCVPAPQNVDGDGITNISMGSIDNTTIAEAGNYGDYSAMSTDIAQSLPLAIDITLEAGFTYNLWAWVDWNNDFDFNDAGEEFYLGNAPSDNPTTFNASITVPLTAPLGNHRIRIGGADSGLGNTSPSDPCYTGTYASFEDYTLNVTAVPSCLPVSDITPANGTGTSIDLSWTENSTATVWDIEVVETGNAATGTPTYNDVTNPYTITGLAPGTSYTFYIRADCGMDDTDASIWIAILFDNYYCVPAPQNVDGDGITNISMGSIDNTTIAEAGNYGDYSAMSTDALQGLPLAIDITLEAGFTYNLWTWVDWNNDFDFNDAGEEFYLGEAPATNPTTFNASITVPPTASLGNHRIRIGGADGGLGSTSPSDPCYTGQYASFEDYTLNVAAVPPPCLSVSDIILANGTGTSIDLSWTENGPATAWDIEVVEAGNAATGTPTYNDVTNPYTITGLAPGTSYTFYVRADCGMDDTYASAWTTILFDNYYCTPAPANVDGDGITNVSVGTIDNTTAAEAGNYGDYSAMSTDAPQGLPLAIDITLEAGFTYNLWAWVDWNNDLDFNDAGEEFYLGEAPSDNPTTFNASITVPPTAPLGNHRIRIGGADVGLGSTSPSDPCYTGQYASFEDYTLNVTAAPSCLPVSDISPANGTGTSVDLSWTENGPATAWDIEVVEAGNAATGIPTHNDVTNPYTITGLTPGTSYTLYVRADCGMDDTDVSIWTTYSFDNYYCTPAPANVDGDGITNVSMGSINNTTVAEAGNYGDYSAMSTDIAQSLPLAIDITLEAGFTYNLWVWVDWNNDFDFNDAGEEFYLGEAPSDNPTTFSASITVPLTASLGNHRIRIGGADGGLGNTSPSDPCYTGQYASFEDYTLNVTAAPSCLSVNDITPANGTGTSVDLSWTEIGSATAWDIEVVEAGNAATGIPTHNDVSNPYTITGLTPGTSYTLYVRADCGMDDTDVSVWTAILFDNYYCTPAPINVDGDGITNVSMGTINNTTVAEAGNYGDYSAMSTDAPQGLPLAIDITLEAGFTYNLWAWVDWNNDFDFNDAGEEFYLGEAPSDSPTTFNASITVPPTAPLGDHRIRVGGADGGLGNTSPSNPCYTGQYAAFEDYTLNVILPPPCQPIADLALSNLSAFSVDVSWTAAGFETAWDIEVVEAGNTPTGIPTYNDITMNPFTITGLTDLTTYNVYVRADCGMDDTDVSIWISTGNFTTPCVAISTFPACEDFTAGEIPDCWEMTGSAAWEFSTNADYGAILAGDHTTGGGTNYAWMDGSDAAPGNLYELITPQYDVSSLTNPYLSYWVFTNNTIITGDNNTLYVEMHDGANWILVETISVDYPEWIKYEVDVNAVGPLTGNIVQFRFVFESTAATDFNNDILVDDVCMDEAPSCPSPSNLTVTNVTATDADIDFVYSGSGTDFVVEYGPIGFVPGTGAGTQIMVNTPPPFTVTGLPSSSDLQIFVQEICAVGDESDFEGPVTIETECVAINTFPACQDFAEAELPKCWLMTGPDAWEFSTGAGFGAALAGDHTSGGGTNYAWMDGSDADPGNLYELYTPFYDVASLTSPYLSYWVFTNNTDNPGDNNTLYVELWDGANWILVETISGDNPDWVEYAVDVNQVATVTGEIQFRFVFESTAATDFNNDILVDDVCMKELPLNDLGVTNITAPASGCGLGVEDISIEITNLGFLTQGGFFTGYSVNGVVQTDVPDGFVSANLVSGASENYTFTTSYDFSAIGLYTIQAWTSLTGDTDATNDTTVIVINNAPTIDVLPFFEDFEISNGGFVAENASGSGATVVWEWGTPTGTVIDTASSGVNAWVTNLAGNYQDNALTYLVAPCMDFSSFDVDPELSFALRTDTESGFDGIRVEVSIDGGNVWTLLGSDTDPDWYNDVDQEFQGDNLAWTIVTHAITGTAGEGDVKIRFVFESDISASAFDGGGIDDVSIVDICEGGLGLSVTSTNEFVEGTSADGTATVTASDGSPSYEYLWSSGGTGSTETGLPNGMYTVTVTNDIGCKDQIEVMVDYTCVEQLLETITYMEESQNGTSNDGSVTVEINTTAPYTFEWSTGNSESDNTTGIATETGLTAGWYEVTITDATGCYDVDSIVVTATCEVSLGATIAESIDESVEGAADGTITVFPTLGVEPYTYEWSTGETTATASGLTAGSYSVTITDVNGCTEIISASIESTCPATLNAVGTGYPETLEDENDGSATVTVGGGVPPYQFDWSNGATGNTAVDLAPDTYTITVTDGNGCMEMVMVTIDASTLNTAIEDIESLSSFMVSPNPTAAKTTVSVRFTKSVDMEIEVVSVVGQLVSKSAYAQTTSEDVLIDLAEVPSGIYFVKLRVDGALHTSRIMKN